MAWSGGNFTRANPTWVSDATNLIGIEPVRHDNQDNDFTTGINECLNKTGQNGMTGTLSMGSNKISNLTAGTLRNDAAQVGQVQDGTLHWGSTSGGSANAQTLTLSPTVTAYVAGQRFSFLAGFTNTAAATLNVNGAGAKNIFNTATGAAIGAGEVVSGRAYEVIYDGTQFLLLNDVTPIQNGDYIWLGTTAGTAAAQTASATPAITAYKTGQKFRALIGAGLSSTGATPTSHTLNINTIGAKTIVHNGSGGNPTFGSWVAGRIIEFVYDGTYMVITNDPGAWQTYSPILRYGASTLAKTVQYAKYKRTGNLLHAQFYLQATALAVATGDISVELPVNVLNYAIRSIGGGYFFDSAPGISYVCSTLIANGNSDRVYFINDASGASLFGTVPAITMNTGDGLLFDLHYEV